MTAAQYDRYLELLAGWRAEGRKITWKEYRLAFQLAREVEAGQGEGKRDA
jgi:hypothetical protein